MGWDLVTGISRHTSSGVHKQGVQHGTTPCLHTCTWSLWQNLACGGVSCGSPGCSNYRNHFLGMFCCTDANSPSVNLNVESMDGRSASHGRCSAPRIDTPPAPPSQPPSTTLPSVSTTHHSTARRSSCRHSTSSPIQLSTWYTTLAHCTTRPTSESCVSSSLLY